MPLIEVHETRSLGDIPSIDITFANGMEDTLVLERFYPTEQSRMAKKVSCNFFGHLENERTACVSVTGCPGQDDMHFTINSKNTEIDNKYILKKDGQLELVESAFKVQIIHILKQVHFSNFTKLLDLWKVHLVPQFLEGLFWEYLSGK